MHAIPAVSATSGMEEVRALIAEGSKIMAIKRYCEITGSSLKVAKENVELMEGNQHSMQNSYAKPAPASEKNEIVALIKQGKKLEAVKLYRTTYDVSLAEAKEVVERIARVQKRAW